MDSKWFFFSFLNNNKMANKITIYFFVFFIWTIKPALAQLNVGIEIRPRTEFRNGFKTLRHSGDDPAFFTEQRSRLTASYQEDNLLVKLSFQDVRIWGSVPQINKTDGFTSVHEAYGEYRINTNWAVRAGRQEFVYDNHRLLGSLDWAAQGRSHDALKIMFEDPDSRVAVHVAGAYNQEGFHTAFDNAETGKLFGTYYSLTNYKVLTMMHASKTFTNAKASLYWIGNGMQREAPRVYFTHTFGPYFTLSPGNTRFEGSLFYQTGKDNKDVDVNAVLAALSVAYPIQERFFPQIGFDYLSGNHPTNVNKRTAFDPLYGTHHAFYGFMDYFYVGHAHNQPNYGRIGLFNTFAKLRYNINTIYALHAHYHAFHSPVELIRGQAKLNRFLGQEVDLMLTGRLSPNVNLTTGYSQMFATESLEFIKGGRKDLLNNWAFVMISFAPTIFTTKNSE
jgi:hypothetical protein